MFDYHVHTRVSYDGHNTPGEMVAAAVAAGLQEICFTDHLDYQLSAPREKTAFTPEQYRQAYRDITSGDLTIRFGAEVGLATWNKEELAEDLRQYPYDFVLGSVHFVDDIDPYMPPYWVDKEPLQAERAYFEEMLRCVKLHDNFDVLGHLTYISKCRAHPCPRVIPLAQYRDLIAEIMKALVAKGRGMEINTSGVDRCGDFLPGLEYLKLFKDLGGEIITVGSDAHDIKRVGQYTDRACAMAKEVFGHVCTFEKRKPVFHKL